MIDRFALLLTSWMIQFIGLLKCSLKCFFLASSDLNAWSQTSQTYGRSPVCMRICALKWLDCRNFLSHSVHANGFSSLWMRRCRFNVLEWVNAASQTWQTNDFSPVWMRMCTFKWPDLTKAASQLNSGQTNRRWSRCAWMCTLRSLLVTNLFGQIEHWNLFTPSWRCMWSFKLTAWKNAFMHFWHTCDFSPEWIFWCRFRWLESLNTLSHVVHLNGFSFVWVRMCLFKLPDELNALSHTWHTNGRSRVCMRCFESEIFKTRMCTWIKLFVYNAMNRTNCIYSAVNEYNNNLSMQRTYIHNTMYTQHAVYSVHRVTRACIWQY